MTAPKPRVLICDDDSTQYEKLRDYLRKEGYSVHRRVKNEAEVQVALHQASESRKWFHFVMLDIELTTSEQSGIGIYNSLSHDFPHEDYIIYSSADVDAFRSQLGRLMYREVQVVLLDELLEKENIQLHLDRLMRRSNPSSVFLVHGRHRSKNRKLKHFLSSAFGLKIVEWETARENVDHSRSYIFDIVMKGIELSHVTVVLFTDEERVELLPNFRTSDDKEGRRRQARANVYIEAGYALGVRPKRTVFVEWPSDRRNFALPTDFHGIHTIRYQDDKYSRASLKARLESARCILQPSPDWETMVLK